MSERDTEPGGLEDYTHRERRRMAVDIAVLQQEVKTLSRDMAELKATNKAQTEKLDQVLEKLSEARGGARTLMLIGGAGISIAATIGGAVAWALAHVRFVP